MTDTPPYRTKLIEVGLPLRAINLACVKEKQPFTRNHPRSMHLYWARRPLVACRAVLFASLVDDPSADPKYRDKGDRVIKERRQELHGLIEEFVQWGNTTNKNVINKLRAEIASSLASFASEIGEINNTDWIEVIDKTADKMLVNKYLAEIAPAVLDPFAGGGSIPLEAQRLGLRAIATDLNLVSVLLNKSLIELPPTYCDSPPVNPASRNYDLGTQTWKNAEGIAEDVRFYANWIRNEAKQRIGNLYPKVTITSKLILNRPDLKKYENQELDTIAWIWSRTVQSPHPGANGLKMPLLGSMWLSRKKGKETWLSPIVDSAKNRISFRIKLGIPPDGVNPAEGTVNRTGAKCLYTGQPVKLDYIRDEANNGNMGAQLVALILKGDKEKIYLPCSEEHEQIANVPIPPDKPDSNLPLKALGFRVQRYGMDQHWKLFSNRQLTSLCMFSDLVEKARDKVLSDDPNSNADYADAIAIYLALGLSRSIDLHNALATWNSSNENVRALFARHAIPMIWDFVELSPFGGMGEPSKFMNTCADLLSDALCIGPQGIVKQHDATEPFDFVSAPMISTDPPYYDNIGYSDLSDFFYIWLKKILDPICPELFPTLLNPKENELIATPYRHDGDRKAASEFFENGLSKAIEMFQEIANVNLPITIYYAYKQTENNNGELISTGWETFLAGLIEANLMVTATWPMSTERPNRSVSLGTNSLASSIILTCRPKPNDAEVVTRAEFIKYLRTHLNEALPALQESAIAPVDLQQASIGPGMAVFSRYEKVLENDGTAMTVRSALGLITQVLDEVLVEQEGEFDADTRFAVVWFEQFGFENGEYGTAQVLATSKGISPEGVSEAGILKVGGGECRLLSIDELEPNWNPETDSRRTVWEVTHYLCKALEADGVEAAAKLVSLTFSDADAARDLAYRLFSICEKKKMSTEAQPYNALVASWADILKVASNLPSIEQHQEASTLFDE